MKIVYSYGVFDFFEKELKYIESQSSGQIEIIPVNHRKFLNWPGDVSPLELDNFFRNGHTRLFELYKYIDELCEGADVFYVDHECVYHPDFILELSKKTYTVIYSGDDPESSYRRSKPYLYAFDHSFCYGVYHNDIQKMADKFLEWGAKRANFRPYGGMREMYNHNLSENDILTCERDIDLIFIGGYANTKRNDFLLRLKKHYKEKFQIYGGWGGIIGFLSRVKNGYGLIDIKKISNEELLNKYSRAKIGINIHQSYGPCNLRMYELPLNGVMQICDNEKGLSELFKINDEVVAYSSFNDLISKIDYYLQNDELRQQIAINGFRKANSEFKFHQTFMMSLEEIKKGILEKNNGN
jgi:spore maturation protein CgeB